MFSLSPAPEPRQPLSCRGFSVSHLTRASFCREMTREGRGSSVKLVADYLEDARQFERLAAAEKNVDAKKQLQDQAEAYYKLAVKRAKALNLPVPPRPNAA